MSNTNLLLYSDDDEFRKYLPSMAGIRGIGSKDQVAFSSLDDMAKARIANDGVCTWVEVCFCPTPLQEERLYWEEYFNLLQIRDAHARKNCRDANGTEPWACCNCDCTQKLEHRLALTGENFLNLLKEQDSKDRQESAS